jgi:hypothetical protein
MRELKRVLVRTLAIAALVGLTTGGSARVLQADSGWDTGTGSQYNNGTTDQPSGIGTGTGGSTDTGTSPSYDDSYGYDQNSGAATGGSTDSSSRDDTFSRGTTVNGVTFPDHSDVLGPSSSDYWER